MNINEIEKKYRSSVNSYKNAIVAWQNVKRATKKDGSDFSNFKKNFINADIRQNYSWCDPQLKVDYRTGDGSWCYDTIEIEKNDTVDDIFEKIHKRINLFNGYIIEDERKASHAERVFTEVDRNMKELINFCKDSGFGAYEVCNYIKDNCWRM